MRQSYGQKLLVLNAAAAANGAPTTGAQGLAMADFGVGKHTRKYGLLLEATAAGALTFDATAWGYDPDPPSGASKSWWRLGENAGKLNNGVAISGTTLHRVILPLENLGWLDRFYLEVSALTGAPTINAWLLEVLEGNFSGND